MRASLPGAAATRSELTLRYMLLSGVALLIVLLLVAGLGFAAVREGLIEPPRITLSFGGARLIGSTTVMPLCPQLVACMMDRPSPVIRVYSLWLLSQAPDDHAGPTRVTPLLSLPLRDTRR
ncbi:MAG TPA: hypothetical protein PKA05_02440 [Roseiflexaceae bacterium]|mgnify:CR=1 FL=1|nr:hypothetical protein [Roseiflexaceae bacterium]HMP39213.1 hypothetical protein [Roseiflexaceae bacterium]